jgi:hypothetical protein
MTEGKSIYEAEMPNIVLGVYGNAEIRIRKDNSFYTLEHRGVPWMSTGIDFVYAKDLLYSQFDLAYGDVLITGLGFGILAKALSEKPEVRSVTVIELEGDVINAFTLSNTLNDKVTIIQDDASTYTSDIKYDCLLPDHYELQSLKWTIRDMNSIAKRVNHDVFWPWSIEQIFLQEFYPRHRYTDEDKKELIYDLNSILNEDPGVLLGNWKTFINSNFNGNKSLLSIDSSKLAIYLEKHAKHYYEEPDFFD